MGVDRPKRIHSGRNKTKKLANWINKLRLRRDELRKNRKRDWRIEAVLTAELVYWESELRTKKKWLEIRQGLLARVRDEKTCISRNSDECVIGDALTNGTTAIATSSSIQNGDQFSPDIWDSPELKGISLFISQLNELIKKGLPSYI